MAHQSRRTKYPSGFFLFLFLTLDGGKKPWQSENLPIDKLKPISDQDA